MQRFTKMGLGLGLLPWQLAYTELYSTDLLWPEFDRAAFHHALYWYQSRQRRFGGFATPPITQGF